MDETQQDTIQEKILILLIIHTGASLLWYLSCEGSIFPPVLCPVVSHTLLFIAQVQAELCHLLLCDLEKQSQADTC